MKIVSILLITLFFSGCIPKKDSFKNFFQSNAASIIRDNYTDISNNLIKLKEKLDKRNPRAYNKKISNRLYKEISTLQESMNLNYKGEVLTSYKDYLNIAFSKDRVRYRNDFLILGIYKLMYEAYEIKKGHKVLALSYKQDSLEKLYYNLQIIKWKIKSMRDDRGEYLFLTWQNNWQIELEKREKRGERITWKTIENLKYIKEKRESIYGHSNFSFEIILTKMIDSSATSLKFFGVEAENMSLNAIKTFIMFL